MNLFLDWKKITGRKNKLLTNCIMRVFINTVPGDRKYQAGFTLLEVLVSVVLLGVIGVAVIRGVQTTSRSSQIIDEQVQAANLATMYVEAIRQLPFDASDPPYSGISGISIPNQYTVEVDAEYYTDSETWNGTYSDEKLQKVIITVSRTGGKDVNSFCYYRIDFPVE